MTKKRVTVTIDPDIDEWLRPEASSTGKSLSNLIRICLREYHELQPERFSTTNRARKEAEETFRISPERLAKRPD